MPINMSKSMIAKLPEGERDGIVELLWAKSGGFCFLCEEKLNRAADNIEPDHDTPEGEGGKTEYANLNLAHESCNRAKRNAKSIPVRPYLKLQAFTKKNGGRLKYDGYLPHFGIDPKPVIIERSNDRVEFELPNGEMVDAQVFSEENAAGVFEYVFLRLPREAIFNDDEVQPRALRPDHAWAIYTDLQRNPLHEPPSCRVDSFASGQPAHLLMFDGQHKAVASWMTGRQHVVAKVYLGLQTAQAVELVNSIQAKIKKLPLSPLELAGKMSDEWKAKFAEYEEAVGSSAVSEKGFLAWLPQPERTRGKQALVSALVQGLLEVQDLRILAHVKRPGHPAPVVSFTEQALKGKVVEKLLCLAPSAEVGDDAQYLRDRERGNIVRCLNMLTDSAFDPAEGASSLTDQELERARRMTYQASLAYVAGLIRQLWLHVAVAGTDKDRYMSDDFSDEQWAHMSLGVDRLVGHPAWSTDLELNPATKALKLAFEKNQGVAEAMEKLGLDLSYLVLGDKSVPHKKAWAETSA